MEKLNRLLKLLSLLQGGRTYNSRELAESCGVSRRTLFRDLQMLRESGVPIQFNEQRQGYLLSTGRLLPPTDFTLDEVLSLLVLCDHLGGEESGIPFQNSARTAAMKLLSTLPRHLREYVGELTESIVVRLDSRNPLTDSGPCYELLTQALAKQCQVRISYRSFTEREIISTVLSPYRILFLRRSWYIIGRSSLHRELRTFNIGRIVHAEALDQSYTIPKRFTLDRYLGNAWQLIREPGQEHQVHIRFQPMVAGNVAEVQWHKTQEVSWNEDGTLDFQVTVDSLKEILWWVLGYGDQAEVLKPQELRDQIYAHARNLFERYAEGQKRE